MSAGRSTPELLGDVISHVTGLFRAEVHLARAEVGEKFSQAISGVLLVVVGAVLLLAAFVVLLGAAVDWIAALGLARHWAGLIVGGAVALIGLVCVLVAKSNLTGENLMPRRTLGQLTLRRAPADAGRKVA